MRSSTEPFNAEVGAALLAFNEEAVLYCQGISDADAHETPWITQECFGVGRRA